MPIRLKPRDKERVRIQPDFIKAVLVLRERHSIWLNRSRHRLMTQLKNPKLDRWDKRVKEKELQEIDYALQLMRARGKGLKAGRGGDDYEITRLRKLSYVRMMVIVRSQEGLGAYPERTWLIGETPHFMDEVRSDPYYHRNRHGHPNYDNMEYNGIYKHGPYLICIDTSCFSTTEVIWHIIPKNRPHVRNRHLHAFDAKINRLNREGTHNPLDGVQTTCWGKFAGIAQSQCEVWDVPGLFDTLFLFAKTLNLDSQLVSITSCPGIIRVERLQ